MYYVTVEMTRAMMLSITHLGILITRSCRTVHICNRPLLYEQVKYLCQAKQLLDDYVLGHD